MLVESIVVSLVVSLAAGYLVAPPGTAYPESSSECSEWVAVTSGLTCASVEEAYSVTEAEFEAWASHLRISHFFISD